MAKQIQIQLLLEDDVINGFSYSFTKTLLEKLKKLLEEGKAWDNQLITLLDEPAKQVKLTPVATCVIVYLSKQLNNTPLSPEGYSTPLDMEMLKRTTEEFLAIFEKEKKEK